MVDAYRVPPVGEGNEFMRVTRPLSEGVREMAKGDGRNVFQLGNVNSDPQIAKMDKGQRKGTEFWRPTRNNGPTRVGYANYPDYTYGTNMQDRWRAADAFTDRDRLLLGDLAASNSSQMASLAHRYGNTGRGGLGGGVAGGVGADAPLLFLSTMQSAADATYSQTDALKFNLMTQQPPHANNLTSLLKGTGTTSSRKALGDVPIYPRTVLPQHSF